MITQTIFNDFYLKYKKINKIDTQSKLLILFLLLFQQSRNNLTIFYYLLTGNTFIDLAILTNSSLSRTLLTI